MKHHTGTQVVPTLYDRRRPPVRDIREFQNENYHAAFQSAPHAAFQNSLISSYDNNPFRSYGFHSMRRIRFPVYPSVFVQADWNEILSHSDLENAALASSFWVSLIRNSPDAPSLHYTFTMHGRALRGGPDYEAKLIDEHSCLIHLYEDARRVDEISSPLYSSFFILAPFYSFTPRLKSSTQARKYNSISRHTVNLQQIQQRAEHPYSIDVFDGVFACGYHDGTVRLFNPSRSLDPISTLNGHSSRVTKIRFFPAGRALFTASADGTARIWNLEDFTCAKILIGHEAEITDCAVLGKGLAVITCSRDGTARVWELVTAKVLRVIFIGEEINAIALLSMTYYDADLINTQKAENTASAETEKFLAMFACSSGRVIGYNLGLWKTSETPLVDFHYPSPVKTLAFLCPELIAVGYKCGLVIIWNVHLGKPARGVEISGGEVSHLIRLGNTHLALVTAGGCLSVLRTQTESGLPLDFVLTGNDGVAINDISYSSLSGILTTCGRDGIVKQYLPRLGR